MSIDRLTEQASALPIPYEPHRESPGWNSPILLYEGDLEIEYNGIKAPRTGKLNFHWLPSPVVRFEVEVSDFDWRHTSIVVRIPASTFEAHGFISRVSGDNASGVLNGVPRFGRSIPVDALSFQLANFHEYVGEPVQNRVDAGLGSATRRLKFLSKRYTFTLDQVSGYANAKEQARIEGGYVVSHAGILSKPDGSEILVGEAEEVLHALFAFLSFARGNWSTPMFARGLVRGATEWEQVAAWRVGAWKDVGSWFPVRQPASGATAWDGFIARWFTPQRQYPLHIAIHWYVEANTGAGGLEGGIVLVQAALELLAAAIIVEEKHLVNANTFEKWSAAKRINTLLHELKIPTRIPVELAALANAAKQLGASPDVAVLTRIRNWIIHPTLSNRTTLASVVNLARWEALQFGLWCVEMIILQLCDYRGVYANRLTHKYVGEVDQVPWSGGA